MDVAQFDYELPSELIAQEPAKPRDSSRLLVLDRAEGTWVDRRFSDLPAFLREGDCVVANQSRVIPARLLGTLEPLFRLAYRLLGARPDLLDLVAGLPGGGTQQALGIADYGSQIVDELTGGG